MKAAMKMPADIHTSLMDIARETPGTFGRTIRKIRCFPRRLSARLRKKLALFEQRVREFPQRRFI